MSLIKTNQIEKTNFSANGQTLELDVAALNTVRFEFSGTYNFIAIFEATVNGTNYFPFQVVMTDASTVVSSHSTANATQAYEASCASVSKIRIRLTAFTSAGTHRVGISGTNAAIEPASVVTLNTNSPSTVPSGTPSEPTPIAVAVTSTSVLAANASRKYLQLINDSDTTIYLSVDGGAAALNTGTRLNANGGSIVFDNYIPVGTVNAIHGSTGTKTLLVTEG